ncbi:MAG: hypothetical protein Q8Q46_02070 [Candidatus Giovannonibacteria bacterium]|nr:hypothetical protein [Candidatus Giovannonibacteria bacterium]
MILKNKKIIIAILITLTLFPPTFLAPKAKALIVHDPIHTAVNLSYWTLDWTKEFALDKIGWYIAKLMVHEISQSIVQWIRTGGQGGSPLFVRDWEGFLLNIADKAGGKVLEQLKLTALCEPFALKLRLAFGVGRSPIQERLRCTISGVVGNLNNFYNDFSQGGWQRWIEITQTPANNPYMAYFIALDARQMAEASAVNSGRNEAIAAGGFLSLKKCTVTPTTFSVTDDDTGEESEVSFDKEDCQNTTPGAIVNDQLKKVFGSEIDQLNIADELNEVLLAAVQQLIHTMLFSAGGVYESDVASSYKAAETDIQNLSGTIEKVLKIETEISRAEIILNKTERALFATQDEIIVLTKLKACQINKNDSISTTNSKIASASSTAEMLETKVKEQKDLVALIKNDRDRIRNAKNVLEIDQAYQDATFDISKISVLEVAQADFDTALEKKTQAEDDLAVCLNPPVVNP